MKCGDIILFSYHNGAPGECDILVERSCPPARHAQRSTNPILVDAGMQPARTITQAPQHYRGDSRCALATGIVSIIMDAYSLIRLVGDG